MVVLDTPPCLWFWTHIPLALVFCNPKYLHTFLQNLLQTRLTHVPLRGGTDLLLDQMKVMMAGCNFCSIELMRIRSHARVGVVIGRGMSYNHLYVVRC